MSSLPVSSHHSPSLLQKLWSTPSSLPELTTATASSSAHLLNSSMNFNTSRTLLPACSPTPAPVTTSPPSYRNATGSRSLNGFNSKYSSSLTKPSTTRQPPTLPICSTAITRPAPSTPPHRTKHRTFGWQSLPSCCHLPPEHPPQTHQRLYRTQFFQNTHQNSPLYNLF